MKAFLFLTLFSLSTQASVTKSIEIQGNKIPEKLTALIKSINPNREIDENITAKALELNNFLNYQFEKEVLTKVVHLEYLKAILSLKSPKILPPNETLTFIRKINENSKSINDPFVKSLYEGVIKDLNEIYESPFFRDYLRHIRSKLPLKTKEVREIHKQLRLLTPWIEIFAKEGPINPLEFNRIKERILSSIITKMNFLIKYNAYPKESFFEYVSIKETKKEKLLPDGLPLIPLPSNNYVAPKNLPEGSQDEWTPLGDILELEESTEVSKDKLNKETKIDDTKAENLPKGSDDWLLEE